MARFLAGALIGVICTVIFYFIPVVNAIAPLLGGLKTGVLMTIFMVIPGILLGGILGSMLISVPVIGGFVAASTFVITLVIVAHTAVIGIIGSVPGAILEENKVI